MPRQPLLIRNIPTLSAPQNDTQRLHTLDCIRGIAVLGILTINIAGFAGPMAAATSPHVPYPTTPIQEATFAFNLLFFEGKMRTLFSLLFGAGIILFGERMEAQGKNGDLLQLRRLGWLLIFGFCHYIFFWWGDILFIYALCGIAALLLRPLNNTVLLTVALVLFYCWHIWGSLDSSIAIHAENAVRNHTASALQERILSNTLAPLYSWSAQELNEAQLGFWDLVRIKLLERPFWQIDMAEGTFAETLPLMLIGMVLYRQGFFDGRLSRSILIQVTLACTLAGLVLTAGFVVWSWPRHFPPVAMSAALSWGLAMPHVLCGCGYAGALVLLTPRIIETRMGQCVLAAGRMAFSNYVLTSIVMTFCFYGWGLGLFGRIPPLQQWVTVCAAWILMLTWSPLWLRHFKQGPLEWFWRCLIEHQWHPNRLLRTTN